MLYYYAHSGHKVGLERVRRGVAIIKKLKEEGKEATLLVNDFRAGLAAKELGVYEYVTIETILDIDAIAQTGDSIIIDSNEDDKSRLIKYCSDFKNVWRFEKSADDTTRINETMYKLECQNENCQNALIVDDEYFEKSSKEQRVLFFLGDTDHHKTILEHEEFFKSFNMELLLGNYFFVKYEDDIAKLFSKLHESEDYMDIIKSSSSVITSSSQTAMEAKVSGADVTYIKTYEDTLYPSNFLEKYGVKVVDGFDIASVKSCLSSEEKASLKHIDKVDIFDLLKVI